MTKFRNKMTRNSFTCKMMAVAFGILISGIPAMAREIKGLPGSGNQKGSSALAAGCDATKAQSELDINNIRTTILVGGDMWWDLDAGKYEVPKGSGKHSLFAGALWIGGIDAGGQIKVAGQTYRQTGDDFWGGPVDTTNTSITAGRCLAFDGHWKVTREEVRNFYLDNSQVTNVIKSWPGSGEGTYNEGLYLAPYADMNADQEYNYLDGDYPRYFFNDNLTEPQEGGSYPLIPNLGSVKKRNCNEYLFGDKTLWWVFNDVGNIHTETSSDPIGLEVRAQAFAFQTNDEINNMTFYKYQIINRSTQSLTKTYFGQWVDPDLGKYDDDFVGCDVTRGLGYCYNGDADDDGGTGYGSNPPAIGVDFFQGPVADIDDDRDNDRDGCEDCTFLRDTLGVIQTIPDNILGEQIIMSKFVYYNNDNTVTGNPSGFADFYRYLQGIWRDNDTMTYGDQGKTPGNPVCSFMFPGTTDAEFFPTLGNWTEASVGNTPADRRFLQSAGPFTLQPGAVNYITTGVVWARTQQGGPEASVDLVKSADDKAQALFDNCFKLIDGPTAPDLVIRELDNRLIFSFDNYMNPQCELYNEIDPTISPTTYPDAALRSFKFQGYQVFQLKDATAGIADVGNPDKIRLVYQCDVADGVSQIVNFDFDAGLGANVPKEMVSGNNKGIRHTFEVTKDLFAAGSTKLVNNKTYYFTVVSYAHNEYKKYDPNDPMALDGQKKPYLAGRNNIKTYTAIPHKAVVENSGQILASAYGSGPPRITRIEGQGNGGMALDFATEKYLPLSKDQTEYKTALKSSPFRIRQPEYEIGGGPLNLHVYDPVLVKNYQYVTRFDSVTATAGWNMASADPADTVVSEVPIGFENEQVIPEWGLTANFFNVIEAGKVGAVNNALITSSIEYSDPSKQWLNAIVDADDDSPSDWIRPDLYPGQDDDKVYQSVVGGTWAPVKLTQVDNATAVAAPKPGNFHLAEAMISLSPTGTHKTGISSIDLVLTSDQSMWTRSAVIEMGGGDAGLLTEGNARKFDLRRHPSVAKDGVSLDTSISPIGMSWFPGYAVNPETGERLNIAFGENSSFGDQNSQDLKWNPTDVRLNSFGEPMFGGMHYIYVFGHNRDSAWTVNGVKLPYDVPMYDSCRTVATLLRVGAGTYPPTGTTANQNARRALWKDAMWVNLPLIASEYQNLSFPEQMPSDVHIRIRVARKYRSYTSSDYITSSQSLTTGTTYYVATVPVKHNNITYNNIGDSFTAVDPNFTGGGVVTSVAPRNTFMPMYEFGTGNFANLTDDVSTAKDALDLINVVPNPYYAFSTYEDNQLDNRIKITNLPPKCTITIFTLGGTLVKEFNRDVAKDNSEGAVYNPAKPNTETSQDWDLKNYKGIPIASGIYLIHVDAPGLGKRTLKWMGMLRPLDLDTF